jgi:hypothetical protein
MQITVELMQFYFSCSLLLFFIFIHSFSYTFNFLLHFLSVYLTFVSSPPYLLSFQFLTNYYFLQYWFMSFIIILIFLRRLFTLFYYVFGSSFILSFRVLIFKVSQQYSSFSFSFFMILFEFILIISVCIFSFDFHFTQCLSSSAV